MRWCLLLLWAQGLRRGLLAAGAETGRIVTAGNISAEEGGSVTLQCHLSSTTASVTQVNWEQQDQLLATHHSEWGWHISPAFSKRVAPNSKLGLTFQALTMNDTGEYFCTYHTFPDGIYRGRLFLEVLQTSGPEYSAGFAVPLLGGILLMVICVAVTAVTWTRKEKFLRIRSAESGCRSVPTERAEWGPSALSSPGSCVRAEAGPAGLCREQRGGEYAEPHDYFNVLSYRSLGDISFPAETG